MWEPLVRNNKFIEKVVDELEGETYTKSVGRKNGANIDIITMTFKQALRVAARESKAVRRSLIDKLEELQQVSAASPAIPQTLPEALRLAAELAEQKQLLEQKAHQLNQQPVAAAPKSILPTGYQWLRGS